MKNPYRMLIGVALVATGCAAWHEHVVPASPIEHHAPSDAAWALLDSNGDGVLSPRELQAQRAVLLLQDMSVADSNHDGVVSRAEWEAWWPRLDRPPSPPSMQRLNAGTYPGPATPAHR